MCDGMDVRPTFPICLRMYITVVNERVPMLKRAVPWCLVQSICPLPSCREVAIILQGFNEILGEKYKLQV